MPTPSNPPSVRRSVTPSARGTSPRPQGSQQRNPSSVSRPPRPGSPLSPTRVSRRNEREEMVELNNRLASFVDELNRVKAENDDLRDTMRSFEETREREETVIRHNLEGELEALRRNLDKASNEVAKSNLERDKLRADANDFRTKIAELETKNSKLARDLESLEKANGELNAKLLPAKRNEEELKQVRAELSRTIRSLEDIKKDLDGEILRRIEAQNSLQTEKEKNDMNNRIMEERLVEVRTQRSMEISEVDSRLHHEYEAKLREQLEDLRADFEDRQTELRNDGEARLNQMVREYEDTLRRKETDLADLRDQKDALVKDYNDILELNVSLDREIKMYRSILEGAETRFNISRQETEGEPSRKRRRLDTLEQDDLEIISSGTATGNAIVSDVDLKFGTFIEIKNKSEDIEEAIGGWKISHSVDGQQEVVYKFHRNVLLKGGATIKVFSADAGVTHDPAQGVFVAKVKWGKGKASKTLLLNDDGVEVANREAKEERRVQTQRRAYSEQLYRRRGAGARGEPQNCSVM